MKKALTKTMPASAAKDRLAIPIDIDVTFPFEGAFYRATLAIQATIEVPDVPCPKCGKTTRQILVQHDVDLQSTSTDAILQAATDLKDIETLAATMVVLLKDVCVAECENISAMIPVELESKFGRQLEEHVVNKLKGLIVCDGCIFKSESANYLEELLNSK